MLLAIRRVTNPVIAETALPNRKAIKESLSNLLCRSSLDELYRPLKGRFISWRQQDVKVIGHDYEAMQSIEPAVTIMQQRINKNLAGRRGNEDPAALPCA